MSSLHDLLLAELSEFAATYGANIDVRQLRQVVRNLQRRISEISEETLLTRKQCAALLGVSLPTLDTYIREEGLPYRIKNPTTRKRIHYLFSRADVVQWSQSHLSGFTRRSQK